jgi:hypothetical protein
MIEEFDELLAIPWTVVTDEQSDRQTIVGKWAENGINYRIECPQSLVKPLVNLQNSLSNKKHTLEDTEYKLNTLKEDWKTISQIFE